jgi:hypothetical protein
MRHQHLRQVRLPHIHDRGLEVCFSSLPGGVVLQPQPFGDRPVDRSHVELLWKQRFIRVIEQGDECQLSDSDKRACGGIRPVQVDGVVDDREPVCYAAAARGPTQVILRAQRGDVAVRRGVGVVLDRVNPLERENRSRPGLLRPDPAVTVVVPAFRGGSLAFGEPI